MAELSGKPATFAKVLKSREVIALGFGAMIGWSWVLMTGVWLTNAGTLGTLIAFAVGGFAVALIGLTYSELASAMPKAGGEHVYTQRALGHRWSFACTWALLFSYVNVCLFEAVALPSAVEYCSQTFAWARFGLSSAATWTWALCLLDPAPRPW